MQSIEYVRWRAIDDDNFSDSERLEVGGQLALVTGFFAANWEQVGGVDSWRGFGHGASLLPGASSHQTFFVIEWQGMNRFRRPAFALLTMLFCLPAGADAQKAALAHVTVNATLSCSDNERSERSPITVELSDVIVTGREYYPVPTFDRLDNSHVRIAFDIPGGAYQLTISAVDSRNHVFDGCSWSAPLITLSGLDRTIDLTMQPSNLTAGAPTDFVSGTIADGAAVEPVELSRATTRCGDLWRGNDTVRSTQHLGAYYYQLGQRPSMYRPGLIVTDRGHVTALALDPIIHTPLIEHVLMHRNITGEDLAKWRSRPNSTIVCDDATPVYGAASRTPAANVRNVDVTAFIDCPLNDLYAHAQVEVELEDQLQRGFFFYPKLNIVSRSRNAVHFRFGVSPGAYDMGMRLLPPSDVASSVSACTSSTRFAVIGGHARHLAAQISSFPHYLGDRGFIAVQLAMPPVRIRLLQVQAALRCGDTSLEKIDQLAQIQQPVVDDGVYYATYDPYRPATQPALMIDGPTLRPIFVAVSKSAPPIQPFEALHVLTITTAQMARWLDPSNEMQFLCQ